MTLFVSLILVIGVAAFIAKPLLVSASQDSMPVPARGEAELWNREKAIAMTAIREAEFDRATGKLSDEDYDGLRSTYEERALEAMNELQLIAADSSSPSPEANPRANFCPACGRGFVAQDRFCAGCGAARP